MTTPSNYGSPITGTLTASTAVVLVNNLQLPATLVLNSTEGGKAIALSVDGTTFFPSITPTATKTGQLYFVLTFPVLGIQFTGAADDTYSIL